MLGHFKFIPERIRAKRVFEQSLERSGRSEDHGHSVIPGTSERATAENSVKKEGKEQK